MAQPGQACESLPRVVRAAKSKSHQVQETAFTVKTEMMTLNIGKVCLGASLPVKVGIEAGCREPLLEHTGAF